MLVLSRKVDERILIGDDIVITIVRVRGDKVRVGVEAPKTVRVMRDELVHDNSLSTSGDFNGSERSETITYGTPSDSKSR